MSWLAGWNYRKAITISNGGSTLTDYQVLITVDTASLVTAGKLLSSCNDIRFTSSDGSTVLNYWIESGPNTSSTKIWIKIPSILSGSNTTYIYYNNTGASLASSGTSTFDFYEDFESYPDGTAIPGTWSYNYLQYDDIHNVSTETAYSGTRCYKLGTHNTTYSSDNPSLINLWSVQITPASVGNWIRAYSRGISAAYGCTGMTIVFIRASSTISIGYRFYVSYATQSGLTPYYDPNSGVAQSAKGWSYGTTYEIDLDTVSAGAWYKAIDRDIKYDYITRTGDAWSNVQKIVIYLVAGGAVSGAVGSARAYYDDITLRKYTATEPTYSISGIEEIAPPPPSIGAISMTVAPPSE